MPDQKPELKIVVANYLEYCRTGDERFSEAAQQITMMTFLSPPEQQWKMVLEAVGQARDDNDLGHVAAGPIEGLLGRHGKTYIDIVERQAASDPKFSRAMVGVRKYTMTEEIWTRVKAIQSKVPPACPG